jgi:hypothetical protein
MHHVHLPPSLGRHSVSRSAVADALCFLAVFVPLAVLTWLVLGEILGGNPGAW